MGFKKIRGINLTEERQGLIRYTCLTYAIQPPEVQKKIDDLCRDVGKDYEKALHDVMCTKKSVYLIGIDNYISDRQLYRFRKRFYEEWAKR